MGTVIFSSKQVGEVPLLVFDFLNVMAPGITISDYGFSIEVWTGDDDGEMGEMILTDSASLSSSIVSVPVQLGTPGCIYAITCSVLLSNSATYQQTGKLAVLDGPTFGSSSTQVTIWSPLGTSTGLVFDFTQEFNSELADATVVEVLGYWAPVYEYSYPPLVDPAPISIASFGTFIAFDTPYEMTVDGDFFESSMTSSGLDSDIGYIFRVRVDGVSYYAAGTLGAA